MIAISSHCPHVKSKETATNQSNARKSWLNVFDRVFYLGDEEPDLHPLNGYTRFIPSEDFPTIESMAGLAARQSCPVAIINADIIVAPKLRDLMMEMEVGRAPPCMYSQRWQFHGDNIDSATLIDGDSGLDVFIALQRIWAEVDKQIPSYFRIGHPCFDGWMSGMFNKLGAGNFTNRRLVFHPIHRDRFQGYSIVHPDTEIDTKWAGIRHNHV